MPSGICVLGKRSGIDLQGRLRHSRTIGQGTLPLPGVSSLSLSGTDRKPDSAMGLVKHHPQNREALYWAHLHAAKALFCVLFGLRRPAQFQVQGFGFWLRDAQPLADLLGLGPTRICPSPQHACLRFMPKPQTLNRTQ